MVNPAVNIALIAAAQQQALSTKAVFDQLKKAAAFAPRSAVTLDLSVKGSGKMLDDLVKRGHVREVGGGRFWLDQEAVARSKAAASRVGLILCAFLLSVGASLLALFWAS
jgi:hypothetical protein